MYILSELKSPECPNITLYAHVVHEDKSSLIIAKANKIELFDINEDGVSLIDTLLVHGMVNAMNHFKPPGLSKHWLIIMTNANKLFVVCYDLTHGQFIIMEDFEFESKGCQESIDKDPIIVVDKENKYFIIHSFQGFIHVITVNQSAVSSFKDFADVKSMKRKRKSIKFRSFFLPSCAIAIGPVTVHSLTYLNNASANVFTELSRDQNFNFTLKFFNIESKPGRQRYISQTMETLQVYDQPRLSFPLAQGGIMLVCDRYLYYYPNQGQDVVIDTKDDNSIEEYERNIIRKDLLSNLCIDSFCIIDGSRILVSTSIGECYMMVFKTSEKSGSLCIASWTLFSLGMLTVADTIVHISGGVFFASSKFSESLLFKVIPTSPYIDVLQYFPSCGPILDITPSFEDGLFNVLTCQGSLESGEIKVIGKSKQTKIIQQFNNIGPIEDITIIHDESKNETYLGMQKFTYTDVWRININSADSTEVSVDLSGSPIRINEKLLDFTIIDGAKYLMSASKIETPAGNIEEEIIWGEFIDKDMIIYGTPDNIIYFNKSKSNLQLENISNFCHGVINKIHYFVFSFWDGSVKIYCQKSKSDFELSSFNITNLEVSKSPILSSLIMEISKQKIIMFGDSTGSLIYFDLMSQDSPEPKTIKFGNMPFKITQFSDKILLSNSNANAILSFEKQNFQCSSLDIGVTNGLCAIYRHIQEPLIVSLTEKNNLQFRKIEDEKLVDTFRKDSKTLYIPSLPRKIIRIPNTKYAVGVIVHGDVSKVVLINIVRMKIIDIYEFAKGNMVSDICLAKQKSGSGFLSTNVSSRILSDSNLDCGFVTLTNSTDETVSLFIIEDGKIHRKLTSISVTSPINQDSVEFFAIDNIHSNVFVVTGTKTIFFVLEIFNNGNYNFVEYPSDPISESTISFKLKSIGNRVIAGDLKYGFVDYNLKIYMNDRGLPEYRLIPSSSRQARENFCFEFDINGKDVILADNLGNVVINGMENEVKMMFNLCDQVNCIASVKYPRSGVLSFRKTCPLAIIATSNGAIYLISELNDEGKELENILLECQEEVAKAVRSLSVEQDEDKMYSEFLKYRDYKSVNGTTEEHVNLIDFTMVSKFFQFRSLDAKLKRRLSKSIQNAALLQSISNELNLL